MVDRRVESTIQTEVCVLGGGPAGSSLALRLRQLGYAVVVVEKQAFPRPHIGESLAGSVLPLFDLLGVEKEIANAGFLRPTAAIVRWSRATQRKLSPNEPGFQVDRGRFDQILLRAAERSGAVVLQPARAVNVLQRQDGGWRLVIRSAAGDVIVECDWLVDATGRARALGGSKRRSSETTLALYAYWRDVPLEGPETRIDAGEDGWYWGAPLPEGTFNATVFIDARGYRNRVTQACSVNRLYENLISRSHLLAGCLRGSRIGSTKVCDATLYYDDLHATTNTIKVGEAAFSIDPLSSQGVQVAIGSAIHAAAVIHTIRQRPDDAQLALEFYRMRQLESVTFHANSAAMFYREVPWSNASEFWCRRVARLERDDDVIDVERPALTDTDEIQLAPEVAFKTIPTIEGNYIVRSTAISLPTVNTPVVFLDGIAVGPLVAMIDKPTRVENILQLWEQQIPASRARALLQWLSERGAIREKGTE